MRFFSRLFVLVCFCGMGLSVKGSVTNDEPYVSISVCRGNYQFKHAYSCIQTSWSVDFVDAVRGVDPKEIKVLQKALMLCAFPHLLEGERVWNDDFAVPGIAHRSVLKHAKAIVFDHTPPQGTDDFGLPIESSFRSYLRICFASAEYVSWSHTLFELDGGGSGCHTVELPRVYSFWKQQFVTEAEFIDMKRFPEICNLLLVQCLKVEGRLMSAAEVKDGLAEIIKGNFTIELDGMRWWVPPYTIFCGACGNVEVFLPWAKLRPYLLPGVEAKLHLSEAEKIALCKRIVNSWDGPQ